MTSLSSLSQALLGQQNRILKLTTPFGNDVFLPHSVVAHERLGRGYEYTVDLVSFRDDVELKNLIAQSVTLWIQQADRSYKPVNGYVHTAKRLGSDGQLICCQISFSSWLSGMPWSKYGGEKGPYARDLWVGVSKKYAEGVTGHVYTVQTAEKLRDTKTVWHNFEKEIISDKLKTGLVTDLTMHSIDDTKKLKKLESDEIETIFEIQGTAE